MLDKITALAGAVLKPIVGLVDDVTTSDEERLQLKAAIAQAEAQLSLQLLEIEARVVESQHKVQLAELASEDAVTRRWRPFLGYGLSAALIVNLGLPPVAALFGKPIPEVDIGLIGICASLLGASAGFRSWEKTSREQRLGRKLAPTGS